MARNHRTDFLEAFPYFREAPGTLVDDIIDSSVYKTAPAHVTLKSEGEYCTEFVFVLSGEKRVYRRSPAGREVTLYEMGPGDICVLNASCILSNSPLPANADSLSDVGMFLIPAKDFLNLVSQHDQLRDFVFGRINEGFVSIMSLVSEVVFGKMDERLSNYLIEKSQDGELKTTHQRIADDLGTSREVVSRLLKDFERQGTVSLARNLIQIKNL